MGLAKIEKELIKKLRKLLELKAVLITQPRLISSKVLANKSSHKEGSKCQFKWSTSHPIAPRCSHITTFSVQTKTLWCLCRVKP